MKLITSILFSDESVNQIKYYNNLNTFINGKNMLSHGQEAHKHFLISPFLLELKPN